jgi:hypothetical protein
MKTKETIPKKQEDFYMFQIAIMMAVLKNMIEWKLDTEWINTLLAPARIEYETAYQHWKDINTRTVEIKNRLKAARKNYEKLLRKLVKMLKASTHIPENEMDNMHIAGGTGGGNPRNPKPTDPPAARIDTALRCWLIIYFGIVGEALLGHVLRGKPKGVHGAEIIWAILPEPPKHHSELIHSAFCTSSPFRLEFDESDRGKTVYLCIRWENTTGEKGPWTEILSAIIP